MEDKLEPKFKVGDRMFNLATKKSVNIIEWNEETGLYIVRYDDGVQGRSLESELKRLEHITWDDVKEETNPKDIGEVSDGYHTFNELYEYRMLYNAALFNEFAKQFGVKEEDVKTFLQKKADESKIKNHYNEIQSGLRSLVEKYKNKYIIINYNIIRITDIISEFGKFIVRGVGFNQFDTWTGLNTYVIDKYHYTLPLTTAEHDVEDVDIFLEDRILSKGAASLHVEEYLKSQKEHINDTFFNEEYTPDFSDW